MFWDNFYRLCTESGKSPNKVAADLGFSTAIATKWKKGTVPKWSTIVMIAEYFGVSPETLVSDQKEKPVEIPTDKMELNAMLMKMTDEQIERMKQLAKDMLGEQ